MLKKMLTTLLSCIMLLQLTACGKAELPEEATTAEITPSAEEAVTSMTEPIDALARCILENSLTYDAQDPVFIWESLFYFIGNSASDHAAVTETEEGYLIVPADVVLEHASVLFSGLSALPELPAIMDGAITYNEADNTYLVTRGDPGLSEMKLTDIVETEDGYTVTAQLWSTYEDCDLICEWNTTLQKLTFAEHSTLPRYLCTVSAMEPMVYYSEMQADMPVNSSDLLNAETITAVFNGLSDSHTAEVTMPDGSVIALQFDVNAPVAKDIDELSEGDGFTFHYITDSSTGTMKLLAIE